MTVNAPPSVSLTTPAANDTFYAPATITLAATASDSDGSVASVAFYAGSTLLATDTSAPYSYTWSDVSNGRRRSVFQQPATFFVATAVKRLTFSFLR